MNKSELIERLAARQQIPVADADLVVNTPLAGITAALARGERTEIRGFGSFEVKMRSTRIARNPKTGERISVPAKRHPAFRMGKPFLLALNSLVLGPPDRLQAGSPCR